MASYEVKMANNTSIDEDKKANNMAIDPSIRSLITPDVYFVAASGGRVKQNLKSNYIIHK